MIFYNSPIYDFFTSEILALFFLSFYTLFNEKKVPFMHF